MHSTVDLGYFQMTDMNTLVLIVIQKPYIVSPTSASRMPIYARMQTMSIAQLKDVTQCIKEL